MAILSVHSSNGGSKKDDVPPNLDKNRNPLPGRSTVSTPELLSPSSRDIYSLPHPPTAVPSILSPRSRTKHHTRYMIYSYPPDIRVLYIADCVDSVFARRAAFTRSALLFPVTLVRTPESSPATVRSLANICGGGDVLGGLDSLGDLQVSQPERALLARQQPMGKYTRIASALEGPAISLLVQGKRGKIACWS